MITTMACERSLVSSKSVLGMPYSIRSLVQARSRAMAEQVFLFAMVPLSQPQPNLYLFTDASLIGWGAQLGDLSASGRWFAQWSKEHINVLELRAV